jgi:DNA polymerase III subunit epsilon
MLLFFDTETTGLPDFRAPSDAPQQPHLVQLACILATDEGETLERWQTIVKPGLGATMAYRLSAPMMRGLTLALLLMP